MSNSIKWVGPAYRALVRRPEGKTPLERPRYRWENNITINLQEVGWSMEWINMPRHKDRWRSLEKAIIHLRFLNNV
jgi:hypothetical protein